MSGFINSHQVLNKPSYQLTIRIVLISQYGARLLYFFLDYGGIYLQNLFIALIVDKCGFVMTIQENFRETSSMFQSGIELCSTKFNQ